MDETLTPERVLEIGREWKRILIQHTPAEEMNELLPPTYKQQFIQQGIEQGIEQGIHQKARDIVIAMHKKGFDLAVIADITGLTLAEVQVLLAE